MGRGVYRAVYSALFDDLDFQALRPQARLLLLTLRQCKQAGPAAIFLAYRDQLAQQTGLSVAEVTRSRNELAAAGWINVEGHVVWVRNGLRHDPTMTLANENHRKAVLEWVAGLPKLAIVLKFCDYYQLPYPFTIPSGIPSPYPPQSNDSDTDSDTDTELPSQTAEPAAAEAAARGVLTHQEPNGHLPPAFASALDRSPRLRGIVRLRDPDFWRAQRLVCPQNLLTELVAADAWMAANPQRAPRRDVPRFLNRWFKRAGDQQREGGA